LLLHFLAVLHCRRSNLAQLPLDTLLRKEPVQTGRFPLFPGIAGSVGEYTVAYLPWRLGISPHFFEYIQGHRIAGNPPYSIALRNRSNRIVQITDRHRVCSKERQRLAHRGTILVTPQFRSDLAI